jgi:hypothetical protein
VGETRGPGGAEPQPGAEGAPLPGGPPAEPPTSSPSDAGGGGTPRRLRLVVAGVAVLLLAVGITAVLLTRGDGGSDDGQSGRPSPFERRVERAHGEDDPDDIEVPDPERPVDLGDDPLLDRLADECFDGDISSCDDLYRESFLGSEYEKYGATCGERTRRGQGGGCTALYPDPDYADLRGQCGAGDERACDDLYNDSPRESVDEHFGSTCGGRSEDELAGDCAAENP